MGVKVSLVTGAYPEGWGKPCHPIVFPMTKNMPQGIMAQCPLYTPLVASNDMSVYSAIHTAVMQYIIKRGR